MKSKTKRFSLLIVIFGLLSFFALSAFPSDSTFAANSTGPSSHSNTSATSTTITTSETKCNKATALGWLVCTLISDLADMVGGIYDAIIEPSLILQTGLLSDEGLTSAWSSFRDIANVLLALLILVIVISQVTGYGIDNYGIKKMLPKIIVAAILLNASLFLCRVCVDISNILGSSFQGFFDGIDAGSSGGGSGFALVITSLVACAGVVLTATGVIGIGAILAGLIAAIVGLITMFILLSIRKAGIILLVAVAPVAFAAMMLPNTRNLFNKWLDMMKGLLILYPVCSLVIGAGGLASRIILGSSATSTDVALTLTAVVVAVAPIFMIPKLTKGAFHAMGNIGATIGGLGQRLGRGIGGATGKAFDRSAAGRSIAERQSTFRARHASSRLTKAYDNYQTQAEKNLQAQGIDTTTEEGKVALAEETSRLMGRRRSIALAEANQALSRDDRVQNERMRAMNSNFINAESVRNRAASASQTSGDNALVSHTTVLDASGNIDTAATETARQSYIAGASAQSRFNTHNQAYNTESWANKDYYKGQSAVASRRISDDRRNVALEGTDDMIQFRRTQSNNAYAGQSSAAYAGATEITQQVANDRAMGIRMATERKAWSDQFANATSGDVLRELKNAIQEDRNATTDQARVAAAAKFSAAFGKLSTSGNLPQLHDYLEQDGVTGGMSATMWNQMNQDFISSQDVVFKQFAKQSFIAQSKGATTAPDLAKFVTGAAQQLVDSTGATVTIKNMAQSMSENLHSLDGQDKDTIEAITKNMTRQDANGNYIYAGQPPVQVKHLISYATSTNKSDELARIDAAIETYGKLFANSTQDERDAMIKDFSSAINGAALSKMSSDVIDSIALAIGDAKRVTDPATGKQEVQITDMAHLKATLGTAISDIQGSETLRAATSVSVRNKLGI